MKRQHLPKNSLLLLSISLLFSGCAVIAVADAVVTTGAVVVKTGVKATGAVLDLIIPDAKPAKK